MARAALTIAINTVLLFVIGAAFWWQDWQYALPTPRPGGFYQPPLGSRPELPPELAAMRRAGWPMLVHYASSGCPCTEFNLDHVRKLQQTFGDRVDFVVALETGSAAAQAAREFESLHLRMPVVIDSDGRVGQALGVYGTPQAVLLDTTGNIYYRGNYNQSRYCVEESSEFVRIALAALAKGRPLPSMPQEAFITFGCPFPRLPSVRNAGAGS